MPTDYRLSPRLAARLMGVALVAIGVLVCLATLLIAVFRLPLEVLTGVVVLAFLAVLVGGLTLGQGGYVVRLTEDGYRVRFVRGAGVKQGRWADVVDAVTAEVAGSPCLVLRLRDGRSTTIPVELLAVDRDAFVRDVQGYLRGGSGLRRPN
ncbi:conserved exported hypothetical protein [metagenome]|uniref:Uncharacterized protein n=1 Tax=metagenome TaxID=256318 RepID=A0A2P2C0W9_9ZZZZ